MIRKGFVTGAAVGAAAIALAGAGGYWARAAAQPGAVNAPAAMSRGGVAPQSFADIVARVAPAVVSIDIVRKASPGQVAMHGQGPFAFGAPSPDQGDGSEFPFDLRKFFPQLPPGPLPPVRASGSGFFISADGYIVTNNHVVEDAETITVKTRDARELPARLVGRDPATDVAVLKVVGTGFPYVSFEDRAKPRVGDWVVAVGNPFGLGGTATAGIVSALARRNVGESSFVDYLQIDAPINRGNSGGPTFDIYGRVVGVNTAIFSPSGGSVGIGFDVPAEVAARVSRELIDHGKVVRGYIGATIQDITPEIAESLGVPAHRGALVADVTTAGPAERAGLKPGDLILGVDGRDVDSAADLTRRVALARPGDTIALRIQREGRNATLSLRAGLRPSEAELADNAQPTPDQAQPAGNALLGLRIAPSRSGGLMIRGVRSGSDAADKGLRTGDVIKRAGGRPLAAPSDLATAVADAKRRGHKEVLLLVSRDGRQLFVPVEIGPARG